MITILAPFVVRIVPLVGPKRLLGASFTIAALSMFNYGGLTIQTDYFHFALARAFQGFGYAFMFVPVTQLAYSYLPKNKNNKGSSVTNLCRNWGGSFGIAFVTTMLERRTQYHQSVLVSHLSTADGTVQQFVNSTSRYLLTRGTSGPDAIHQSYGLVSSLMTQQAAMLGLPPGTWSNALFDDALPAACAATRRPIPSATDMRAAWPRSASGSP